MGYEQEAQFDINRWVMGLLQVVAEFTGTTNGRLARAIVIDAKGQVVWFDDAGYAARKAMGIADLIAELEP